MADPRLVSPTLRSDPRSPLMIRKAAGDGVTNECPFGCRTVDLDENGYCHHLIGFTNGQGFYEPNARKGNTITTDGGNPLPLPPGAVLKRITTSARVYTQAGNPDLKRVTVREGQVLAVQIQERIEEMQRAAQPVLEGVVPAPGQGRTIYDMMPAQPPAQTVKEGEKTPAPPTGPNITSGGFITGPRPPAAPITPPAPQQRG